MLREAVRLWGYVGLNSFGGPAGQIAVMHREVVDRRGIVDERRFLHALNFCMLLPGPEAQQLATYLGWVKGGVRGGLLAGLLFIAPGAAVMLLLSMAFAVVGDVPLVRGLLLGLQAAVVAIVIQAVLRLGRRTLRSPLLVVVAVASFIAIVALGVPFPAVVVAGGLLGWLIGRIRPALLPEHVVDSDVDAPLSHAAARAALRAAAVSAALWLIPLILLVVILGPTDIFARQALLFSTTAVVTFGGAYAALGYIAQRAVVDFQWLSSRDMATGLALAETTPGPLVLVIQFVGFISAYNNPGSLNPLIAGCIGAAIALWMIFVPCFLFIFLGAPYVERLRHSRALHHALTAVGAVVVGVVASLALLFATTTAFSRWPDLSSLRPIPIAIAVVGCVLVFVLRLGTLKVLAACAALGIAATLLLGA